MAQVITSPMPHIDVDGMFEKPAIFLGGSIEQGTADNWQVAVINSNQTQDVIFINPRRRNWDSAAPDHVVRGQIQWELEGISKAHCVLINFIPHTLSPISLLEMGLLCGAAGAGDRKRAVIVSDPAFWRNTNVEETCKFFDVPLYKTLAEGIEAAIEIASINFSVQESYKVVK